MDNAFTLKWPTAFKFVWSKRKEFSSHWIGLGHHSLTEQALIVEDGVMRESPTTAKLHLPPRPLHSQLVSSWPFKPWSVPPAGACSRGARDTKMAAISLLWDICRHVKTLHVINLVKKLKRGRARYLLTLTTSPSRSLAMAYFFLTSEN